LTHKRGLLNRNDEIDLPLAEVHIGKDDRLYAVRRKKIVGALQSRTLGSVLNRRANQNLNRGQRDCNAGVRMVTLSA
jgi:hypothetical protein